mgnify:CR=1 FL=1
MVSPRAAPIAVGTPVQGEAVPPTAPPRIEKGASKAVGSPIQAESVPPDVGIAGPRGRSRPSPRSSGPDDPPIVSLTGPPRPFFEVWSSNKQMGPEEKRVFEQVRDALADNKSLPAHRVEHFSWLEANHLRASSWTADLMSAEPIENGHLVTLRIMPRIGSPSSQISIIDWSIERYKVFNDGGWAFVDGTTPPGTGRPGWIID